jgi:hypothetical protein
MQSTSLGFNFGRWQLGGLGLWISTLFRIDDSTEFLLILGTAVVICLVVALTMSKCPNQRAFSDSV